MKKIVVLTGAGMSVESGLKTFRDADGLWEEYPVQQVATHEGWLNDPTLVTNFYNMLRKKCWGVKPNEGHKLVAELEKNYEVTVGSTSNGNRAVTLDRVVTRLRVTATDEVPTGCASMTITPAVWYYGLNYVTGAPTDAHNSEAKVINVPASYVGTTGQLTTSIFSVSGATEWNTNVAVVAKNTGGDVIGSATIANAPFKANRSTDFSGPLFGSAGSMSVSINDEWSDPYEGTW